MLASQSQVIPWRLSSPEAITAIVHRILYLIRRVLHPSSFEGWDGNVEEVRKKNASRATVTLRRRRRGGKTKRRGPPFESAAGGFSGQAAVHKMQQRTVPCRECADRPLQGQRYTGLRACVVQSGADRRSPKSPAMQGSEKQKARQRLPAFPTECVGVNSEMSSPSRRPSG
jgi:hypothetical protein